MQPRIGTTLDAPTATFNDTGTAIPYDGVGVEYDQQLIINTATIEIESGGTPQVATDAASIAEYFVQALAITDSLLQNDAEALTLADYLLEGIPAPRLRQLARRLQALQRYRRTRLHRSTLGKPCKLPRLIQLVRRQAKHRIWQSRALTTTLTCLQATGSRSIPATQSC
jgi:hypothetical protein